MSKGIVLKAVSGLLFFLGSGSAQDKDLLKVGDTAPPFALETESGEKVSLELLRGKKSVVLIFYPGDQTPGCTKQLCAVRDDWSAFERKGAVVYGVNFADRKSHASFAQKHGFQFPLLIDRGSAVTRQYGAKGAVMARRTVYVIDREGRIVFARRGTPPNEEILASITDK